VKNYNSIVYEKDDIFKMKFCFLLSFAVSDMQVMYLVARYGVNGHDCMLRTLCEAKERLKSGNSLVEDILQVVFR
jgi:hypothetical protein